jgi:hypothetical protein
MEAIRATEGAIKVASFVEGLGMPWKSRIRGRRTGRPHRISKRERKRVLASEKSMKALTLF